MKTIISKSFPILTSQTRIMDRYQPWGMHKYIPYGTSRQSGIYRGKTGHRTTLSFRTSVHTGVGISIKIRAAFRHTVCSILAFSGVYPRKVVRLSGGLPHQESGLVRNDREFVKFQFVV